MNMWLQPQGFAYRQPGTPQAETLVAAPPPFLHSIEWLLIMGLQVTQLCGDVLQMHNSLLELRSLCYRLRRCPRMGLHDLVDGDFLMLHVMPEPAQRWQGSRCRIQGPADAPLPAGDPPPQGLFLG